MRSLIICSIFLSVFFSLSFVVFKKHKLKIDSEFIGTWKEKDSENLELDQNILLKIASTIDEQFAKTKSPSNIKWNFYPNGKLIIETEHHTAQLDWHIKGRGNVLEIKNGDLVNHFSIMEHLNDKLEMNYISDIQIKEPIKINLSKI
jgi:hypothetical protein